MITVYFQGSYALDLEVPENWEPTPENITQAAGNARNKADFTDGGASWDPYCVELGNETYEVD